MSNYRCVLGVKFERKFPSQAEAADFDIQARSLVEVCLQENPPLDFRLSEPEWLQEADEMFGHCHLYRFGVAVEYIAPQLAPVQFAWERWHQLSNQLEGNFLACLPPRKTAEGC